jgi:ABC-type glycerol-3-phosphate transport system substrate-binding protein
MKKNWLIVVCFSVLGLVACQNKTASHNGDTITEVSFAFGNLEPQLKENWEKYYLNPYRKNHPNVKITFLTMNNIEDTVRVQIAAGAGPDMFPLDCFEIPSYANSSRIIKLDTYAQKYNWPSKIYAWALGLVTYENSIYALPHASEVTGLYYNNDLLKKYGLQVPKTRAEYIAACKLAMGDSKIALGFGFSDYNLGNQWVYDHYLTAYAGADGIKKLFSGILKFTDSEIAGAFRLVKEDWDAGFINEKMSGAITADEGRNIFVNGDALFNPEGTWVTLEVVTPGTWTFDWGLAPWPSFKEGVSPAGAMAVGQAFAINANSKYPDICAEILDGIYADSAWVAEGIAAGLPAICTVLDATKLPSNTSKDVLETIEAINDIGIAPSYAPWASYPPKTNVYLMENIAKLWYGDFTLEQFLSGAQRILDEELAAGFTFVPFLD